MTLVDTSVWIDHFRSGNGQLRVMLEAEHVLTHPFVVGELACGSLRNRTRVLSDLGALPTARTATHREVLRLIDERKLWSKGIGWIDAHLIASALISSCRIWSLDHSLASASNAAGVKGVLSHELESRAP